MTVSMLKKLDSAEMSKGSSFASMQKVGGNVNLYRSGEEREKAIAVIGEQQASYQRLLVNQKRQANTGMGDYGSLPSSFTKPVLKPPV